MARGKRIQQVLLADTQQLFRRGLRSLLSGEGDFQVIGETSSLEEAMARAYAGCDALVMDVSLLEGVPETQILRIRQLQTNVPVLFLAQRDLPEYLNLALSAGGRGYMLKSSSPSELLAGIRKVVWENRDEAAVSNSAADLKALAESGEKYARGPALTSREQEILRLLAEGRTVRETAAELALSIKTVEAHKLNFMRKLNIHNRTALVEYALEKGMLPAGVPA